ncbi:MAG: hypothetical protein EPN55_11450 [Gammaproteobacteria bacterium]|nr:MAG: hypothetical protein EPN55_11450 [Gammaproteobacteria bacterium]
MAASATKTVMRLLALMAAVALSACVIIPSSYETQAFGKSKKFAVVSVFASPEISSGSGTGSGIGFTVSGLIKAVSDESGYHNDADKILADTSPQILKDIGSSRHYTLVPARTVLDHKAYRAAEAEDTGIPLGFGKKWLVAPGYKFIKSEDKLGKLARELNVDAVMVVTLHYSAGFTGAQVGGLVAGGTHSGKVMLTVYAVDRNGKVVWKDGADASSDNSIGGIGESVNFTRLHPLLIEATRNATKKLMENVNSKVASL